MSIAVPDRQPWERQPKETSAAFQAFAYYRDLGTQRSLRQVAEWLIETNPRRTTTSVENVRRNVAKWSTNDHWQERIDAYELHNDRAALQAREQAAAEMRARHLETSEAFLAAVRTRVLGREFPNGENVEPLDPAAITDWSEAARLFETGVKQERLARGLPTDISQILSLLPASTVKRLVYDIVEAGLPFVPEEAQSAFLSAIEEVCRNA
jgi:hypothetical protein